METRIMERNTTATPDVSHIRISALIPAYNRAHLLPRAIESVMNQSFPPAAIIVVDDGSTDNTREVLEQYGDQVTCIFQENAGSAAARHQGMLAAQTEWVALLDSDDMWLPDHLSNMSQVIELTGGRASYYFADTRRPEQEGGRRLWEITDFSISEPYLMIEDATKLLLAQRPPMMLQSTVFNKEAYLAVGGFWPPLRYRDDTHLFIKMGLQGPICAVAGVGAVMTDDDIPENRLSANYDGFHYKMGKEMQVLMNQELLDYFGDQLTDEQRSILQTRLAKAHFGMANVAMRERDIVNLISNIGLTIKTEPLFFLNKIGRMFTL